MLVISPSARISPLADVEDSTRGSRIETGDEVVVDSFVKIKAVGGADVLIAANVTIAPVNHEFSLEPINTQRFQPSRGGILIEDDVWVGAGSVILDGAVLRRGVVVGAGSVVRGELEAYSISAGNPPRVIGYPK
jgi:virginiamycin A acetyltransferase